MKVLHISPDETFVDYAYDVFESVAPFSNDIWVFSKEPDVRHVTRPVDRLVRVDRLNRGRPKVESANYCSYDLVVFHSLSAFLYPEIFSIPNEKPKIWIGWGFDYYDLVAIGKELILPNTQNILQVDKISNRVKNKIKDSITHLLISMDVWKDRKNAISRLSGFSPVLKEEYKYIFKSCAYVNAPYFDWNYGVIIDHLLEGNSNLSIQGNHVLLGNSATPTNNHVDAFHAIRSGLSGKQKVIVPLSYGDNSYARKVSHSGFEKFGSRFQPLLDYVPLSEFNATLQMCGYVVMNQVRQQGLGTIIVSLYLGARVFLRAESPTYKFFKSIGIWVTSVQELEEDPQFLSRPLSSAQIIENRRIVSDYWSEERAKLNAQNIINQFVIKAD